MSSALDAVVIGSGPNGLACAVALAREGFSVLVREAQPTLGGGARSGELTLEGFTHDLCSAVHPLGVSSPFFRALKLEEQGLEWIHPGAPLAHPFDDGTAATLERGLAETAARLGRDEKAYLRLFSDFVKHWDELSEETLGPPLHWPRHPWLLARFGLSALRSVEALAHAHFRDERTRALFAGVGAHAITALDQPGSGAIALLLTIAAHGGGWPVARGGSQAIADALARLLRKHGGRIECGAPVRSIKDLPPARAVVFDLTPRQILNLGGDKLPPSYRGQLEEYLYGPGVFKIDWALNAPIPWRSPECARAGTVHLGGSLAELARSERAAWNGELCERPFVLLSQPSLFDATRAPAGKHTAWAYCHVPHGSQEDLTSRIEAQVERFAPGFRDVVAARFTANTAQMEARNANLVGGDIAGGAVDLRQLLFRPAVRPNPYSMPVKGWFICSASTPPGAGVHGMCGYQAARQVLRYLRKEKA